MNAKKRFDAVRASRRWRARSSRELAGLTYEQLQARLSRFATAEALVKPAPRHARRKVKAWIARDEADMKAFQVAGKLGKK